MRSVLMLAVAAMLVSSCNNSGKGTSFCDTNCNTNELSFAGQEGVGQSAVLKLNNCIADTLTWTHEQTINRRKIHVSDFMKQEVRINKSAIRCNFQDTSFVWLSFNDCLTGRGYILKLPYNNNESISRISGALNSFDTKFSVDADLLAYTDRGNLYVDNVVNGKKAQMTFRKEYKMDFANIHEYIDTVQVTKQRMYIVLIDENGQKVPFEKKIDL